MPIHTRTTLITLLALAGLPLSISGCSAERSARTDERGFRADSQDSPALARLEQLASAQAHRAARTDVPLPPGLGAESVGVLDPLPPEATTPLEELLPRLASEVPAKAPEPAPVSPDDDASVEALRLYARARAAANANDTAAALAFIDSAAKADATRPEIWRLRGDILGASGQRLAALAAYQRVLDLGLIEPRACLVLGLGAADRSDNANAARYLAGAIANHPEGEDPALVSIAHAALGPVLHKLGYLTAGNEAIGIAVGSSLQFTSTTMYRQDLQTLARRRSDLARDAGDAWARIGDTDRALIAYEQAAMIPSFDPSAITERRVYVLARAGRPAEAALVLLDDVAGSGLRVDDSQLSLFRYLSTSTDLGPLLADAVAELPAHTRARALALGLPAPLITPTVEGRLARAAAAIHPPTARRALERHLVAHPTDQDAARDWIALFDRSTLPDAALGLLGSQPMVIGSLCEELSRSPAWAWVVEGTATVTPVGATLCAGIRASQGEFAEADRLLRSGGAWNDGAGAAAQALCAAEIGDTELADELLASVREPAARARVLLSMQRTADARTALSAAVLDSPTPEVLALAAEIAISARDAASAESLFRRAIEADPFDESLYDGLAALYRPGAPLADQDKLFGVYRDLRQAVPSSRTIRTLNAQEAAQRGSLAQAETELVALVQQDPDDPRAVQLLLAVWQRRLKDDPGVPARAESLLNSLREQCPGSPSLAIAKAQVLALGGRSSEAEALLVAQIAAYPSAEVAQSRDALLRDELSRSDEADQMAIVRLSPMPRPIDSTIELARVLARSGELDAAARTLEKELPTSATLTPSQGAEIQLILADVGPSQDASTDPAQARAMLRIIDVAIGRGVAVTPGIHELRVALLATGTQESVERIINACRDARAQAPALGMRPTKRAIASLADSNRHADALEVAIAGLESDPIIDTELALMGVRLVVLAGNAEDLRRVIDDLTTIETAGQVLQPIHPDGPLALEPGATLEHAHAEIAFMVGNYLTVSADRRDYSDDMYRLALAYEPTHAMAANNLGYSLLERDSNREEANALLESAYRNAPDDPNVVDSIGWLRYQQGRMSDSTNPDGSTTEGAMTLLQRAIILDSSGGSPVSLDHYADALWAGGERGDAIFQWEQALSNLEREMSDLEASGRPDPDHPAMLESLRAKLEAARTGGEPRIAPQRWATAADAMPTASSTSAPVPSPDEPGPR